MENEMEHRLVQSMKEALEYVKGDLRQGRVSRHKAPKAVTIPETVDLKSLRQNLQMTQEEFANRYGFNLHTLRNWEHGRRHPDKAILAYLYLISKNPILIENTLHL